MSQCFECGSEATQNHHVVPHCLGGKNTIPLCDACHDKVHSPESTLAKGRLMRSSKHGRKPNKLDPLLFESIWLRRNDLTLEQAARKFGVSHTTILRVFNEWDSTVYRDVLKLREFYLKNHEKFTYKP